MTPLATPVTDLHARRRGAGLSGSQAETIAAGLIVAPYVGALFGLAAP